jgi:hypothetical protein
MHPLFKRADELSNIAIGAAVEVHRMKGPDLIESIYERCLMRELELRKIAAVNQRLIKIEYNGLVFEEPLRFDGFGRGLSATGAEMYSGDFADPQGTTPKLHEAPERSAGVDSEFPRN